MRTRERTGDGTRKSRSEISDDIEQSDESMQEQLEEIEKGDADVEQVRDTIGALELGGTSDGADAVRSALDDAQDTSIAVFDEKDSRLDEIQDEGEVITSDLDEQTGADEKDAQEVTDAGERMSFDETIKALDEVQRQLNEDIEFLKGQLEKAQKAISESEVRQQEHRNRVHSE